MNEPTHLMKTLSSRIYLIFSSQPNLVIDPGVYSFLYASYQHQIIYAKLSLNVIYMPPYGKEDRHYKETNLNCIQ